jgi:hypothetical protein
LESETGAATIDALVLTPLNKLLLVTRTAAARQSPQQATLSAIPKNKNKSSPCGLCRYTGLVLLTTEI